MGRRRPSGGRVLLGTRYVTRRDALRLAVTLALGWGLPDEASGVAGPTAKLHPVLRTQRWRMASPANRPSGIAILERAKKRLEAARGRGAAKVGTAPAASRRDLPAAPVAVRDPYGFAWYQPFSRPRGGWPIPLTPGQQPAGHPSYVPGGCRTHVDPSAPAYRGLRPRSLRQSKKVQPAWLKGHMNKKDMAHIDRVLGAARTRPWCPYLTKECVEPNTAYTLHTRHKRREDEVVRTVTLSQQDYDALPSLPPGSLGTCAFVALSDQLKYGQLKFGRIIDAHDTVIRPGHPPLAGYERYVGSRADAVVHRNSTMSQTSLPRDYRGVRYTLGYRLPGYNATAVQRWGLQRHWDPTVGYDQVDFWHTLYSAVAGVVVMKNNAPRWVSTGGTMALELALSGLCSRLDVYGMSNNHGVHYFCDFDRRNRPPDGGHYINASLCTTVKRRHSPGLETWLLHYMMKNYPEFNMCIYM